MTIFSVIASTILRFCQAPFLAIIDASFALLKRLRADSRRVLKAEVGPLKRRFQAKNARFHELIKLTPPPLGSGEMKSGITAAI